MKLEFLDLVLSAGAVAKSLLVVLLLFSMICWTIVFDRFWLFRRLKRHTTHFLRGFSGDNDLLNTYAMAQKFNASPMAKMFCTAYDKMKRGPNDKGDSRNIEVAIRAMRQASSREISKMERYLPFLATTASTAPFIGLFGTVWGIMESFRGIGSLGSASLAVVAPGISEALIATAAGLGAAIPAVMAYNFFVNRVKHWAVEMDNFRLELTNLLTP